MKNTWLVTVSRQCSSTGSATAKKLAEELGFDFLDKNIMDEAAQKLGMDVVTMKEQYKKGFSYFDIPNHWYYDMDDPESMMSKIDKILYAQNEMIREHLKKNSCVALGRCADYILSDTPHMVKIYFTNSEQNKIAKAMKKYNINEKAAKKYINMIDKKRAKLYNSVSLDKKWGDKSNYDFYIDLGETSVDEVIAMVKAYIEEHDN